MLTLTGVLVLVSPVAAANEDDRRLFCRSVHVLYSRKSTQVSGHAMYKVNFLRCVSAGKIAWTAVTPHGCVISVCDQIYKMSLPYATLSFSLDRD